MTSLTIKIAQPAGEPWPAHGHHVRIDCYDIAGRMRHIEGRDIAMSVGSTRVDTVPGHHIIRLFATEGSFVEEQIEIREGQDAEVRLTLEAPCFPFHRPEAFSILSPRAFDTTTAWQVMEGEGDAIIPPFTPDTIADPRRLPSIPGIHMAMSEVLGRRTMFRLPWSPDAILDARHYGSDEGREPDRQRTRARCVHQTLGMLMPHVAMNQINHALPQVQALMAQGALEQLCRDGDACGAMAMTLVLDANHHERDPDADIEMVAEAFPSLPDPLVLLAYRRVVTNRLDDAVELALRSFDHGPPCFTQTVSTLNMLAIHLHDVSEIKAKRRIASRVDPGSLFTSIRI